MLPTDTEGRKARPLTTGCLDYFPDAIAEVANASFVGNEQHHPGTPLHWDKDKSTDEADCLVRHLMQRGTRDSDGVRHTAKVAWRALALLQREIESEQFALCPAGNLCDLTIGLPCALCKRRSPEFDERAGSLQESVGEGRPAGIVQERIAGTMSAPSGGGVADSYHYPKSSIAPPFHEGIKDRPVDQYGNTSYKTNPTRCNAKVYEPNSTFYYTVCYLASGHAGKHADQ